MKPRTRKVNRKREQEPKRSDTRTLVATVAAIVVSSAVALPAQALWFLDRLVGRNQQGHYNIGPDPQTLMALSSPLLVEGMAWYCAHLYADSVQRRVPQRLYRLGTLAFSCFAASINFSHGAATNTAMGLVFAMASLMGVGAWELYMLRSRHENSGMTGDEIKLWALRWRRHPRVMREASRIRATFGLAVPREVAWRMSYIRKIGNPTVPVATTDEVLERLFRKTNWAEPAPVEVSAETTPDDASETATDTSDAELETGTATVLELPVGWNTLSSVDDVIGRFWPEVNTELDLPDSSTAGGSGKAKEFRSEPVQRSASKPRAANAEQRVTSKVPTGKRNSSRARNGSHVQFPPTKAELEGGGTAQERIVRYLVRAEAKGHDITELDRKYIEQKFEVSDRHVRNAITAHKEGNQ